MAEPCKAGKLSLDGFRWGAYLYGGESHVSYKTYATTKRYDALLARRTGDCDAFRAALAEEGYNGLPDREAEYNIYLPHNFFTSMPIEFRLTVQGAKDFISQYPIPCWIGRDSPLYRDWELCQDTWDGKQTVEEMGLTESELQDRMGADFRTNEPNPPSPYTFGPPPSPFPRGTPRGRAMAGTKRNEKGQFTKDSTMGTPKKVSMTEKEAKSLAWAAAAVTYLADNPSLLDNEWSVGAKAHKDPVLNLAKRANTVFAPDVAQAQTPSAIMDRLNLSPAIPSTAKRARFQMDLTQDDDDEEGRVYKKPPTFGANPFMSKKKKAEMAVTLSSDKTDPTDKATVLEAKTYYQMAAKFMTGYGNMAAIKFAQECPGMVAYQGNAAPLASGSINVGGRVVMISLLHDGEDIACVVPNDCVVGIIKATESMRAFDPETTLADNLPVSFILYRLLRMSYDFGTVRLIRTEAGMLDTLQTINKWIAKFEAKITTNYRKALYSCVAGLVDYAETHGLVKCHALSDTEVDQVSDVITDETIIKFFNNFCQILHRVYSGTL